MVSNTEKYFATFSSGGWIDLWQDFNGKGFELVKSSKQSKRLQETISLSVLDKDYLLLLTGGYDSLINIYTVLRTNSSMNKDQKEVLTSKFSLKGHANSIKDISVISSHTTNLLKKDFMMIATCSQDCYIRLWSVVEIKLEDNVKDRSEIFEEYKSKTSYVLKVDNGKFYNILLDSVLLGHEESVSSVKWAVEKEKLILLSSSFDFTVGIWRFSEEMVFNINLLTQY